MQKIKYQLLANSDDVATVHYSEECKRHFLLKFVIIFLVLANAIYLIHKFESLESIESMGTIFANETNLFGAASVCRNHTLCEDVAVVALPRNNSRSRKPFATAINSVMAVTTANVQSDEIVNVTTQTFTEATSDLKPTTIYYNNIHKIMTPNEKPTMEFYVNKRLWQTTQTFTDLQTTNIQIDTTTTTVKPFTTSLATTAAAVSSSEDEKKYFINTSNCHIPFVEPFTPEILKIFKPQHSTGCTKDQAIVTSLFNELTSRYILHINFTAAETLGKHTKHSKLIEEDLSCCYQQVVRSGSGSNVDRNFKLLPCANFHQDFVVPLHVNGIIVNCKIKSTNKILQQDAFSFVQVNKTEILNKSQTTTNKRRRPSFLLIGIDTLSRINFRRNMPETLKFLIDNKWHELKGYNKVGDNTLPNLMPLLSGYTKTTVYKKCNPVEVGRLDNCNFIWTTLKNYDYQTAYAEDTSFMSTFNYKLKGFSKPPTDYYFRPMSLAIEKSLKRKTKAGLNYCVGRRQLGEYIYDYATEFATRFKNVSSFGFFWTNSFSHNSFDISATMDTTMTKYLKEWRSRGIFEDSIVIFFSDHGERWGPLLKLSQGFLETRLPMFFISVPSWFRQAYPQLVKNLEINQRRLATPFDIHMTFQHLLSLAEPNYQIQQTFDCPKCQSIFLELPENRTCDDASIPQAWCTCIPFKTESTKSKVVQTVANMIVQELNHYYELKNLTSLCSALHLKEVTNAKSRYPDETKSPSNTITYAIDFTTKPLTEPKTVFSATVDYDKLNKRIHLDIEDISRQSRYESTAKCTDDKQAKKYCICKNSLNKKMLNQTKAIKTN